MPTSPKHDPVAFRSDKLPTEHFNERFSDDNLAFWVPLLVDAARITPGVRVLDVGCGTGGFSRAIAETAGARVVGLDSSPRFVEFARSSPAPKAGAVEFLVGGAEELPLGDSSFERVLLSLVLHQLARPVAAVAEAFRVLVDDGIVLVRTIAPDDAARRVPERFIGRMAAADAARLPPIAAVEGWLEGAGFVLTDRRRVLRNKKLRLEDEERQLLVEARSRYAFLTAGELDEGLRLMRADAAARPDDWIDPRPTYLLSAAKPGVRSSTATTRGG